MRILETPFTLHAVSSYILQLPLQYLPISWTRPCFYLRISKCFLGWGWRQASRFYKFRELHQFISCLSAHLLLGGPAFQAASARLGKTTIFPQSCLAIPINPSIATSKGIGYSRSSLRLQQQGIHQCLSTGFSYSCILHILHLFELLWRIAKSICQWKDWTRFLRSSLTYVLGFNHYL